VYGNILYPEIAPYSIIVPANLIAAALILTFFHSHQSTRFLIYLLIIFIAGFSFEAIGVNTGWIFGHYEYHESLGIKIFDTPIIIGLNWVILIYCVYDFLQRFNYSKYVLLPVGGLLMVFYDIALEPNAIRMNMWSWQRFDVPFHNYVGWFVISVLFLSLLFSKKHNYKSNPVAPVLFFAQLIFFLSLNIYYSNL
jgi:putative membrane protein